MACQSSTVNQASLVLRVYRHLTTHHPSGPQNCTQTMLRKECLDFLLKLGISPMVPRCHVQDGDKSHLAG